MRIRVATSSDLPALADLAARTFPLACPPHLSEEDVQAFIGEHLAQDRLAEYLADPARLVLLGDDDQGRLAGYVMVVAGEPSDAHIASLVQRRPTVELNKCYVAAEAQGTGVAASLVTAAVDWSREQQAASIWLGVNGLNRRAQRFYAKQGFEVVGERQFPVGSRVENDLVLAKPLP